MIKELPTDSLLLPRREALRECRQFINDLFVSNSGEGMKFVERILYKLEPKTSTFIIQRNFLAEEAFSYKSGNLVKSMNQKIAESKWATNNLMRYFNPESVIQVGQKLDSLNDLEKLNVIITPGIIFGKEGDNFFRVSGLAPREVIEEAMERIRKYYEK